MSVKRHETPLIALLSVGSERDDWRAFRDVNGFRWHVVEVGPTKRQAREVWISEALAAVVFVGRGEAVDRAIDLLHLLRGTGPPVVIAIADPVDVRTEKMLRQTGAIYLCSTEAQLRLVNVLREMLCHSAS